MNHPPEFVAGATGPLPGMAAATGRVALVTGGARGVGAAIVRTLAARGHAVAVHGHASFPAARGVVDELAKAGIPGLAVTANLRDEGAVRTMVHRVSDHFGRLDVVVLAAGIDRPCPAAELTADDLRMHHDVNCVGGLIVAQEAAAAMRRRDGGAIVMLAAPTTARSGHLAAAVTGGSVQALAAALAAEFHPLRPRVRVNCLVADPALVVGPGMERWIADAAAFLVENEAVDGVCLPVSPTAAAAGGS
jgi:NAD(P)-dependent dehydrogenase (short-subunit alcohol dehydrogenase family)